MSRRLILFRHAKSDWDTGVVRDHDRPLAARGRRDVPRMGRWLRSQGKVPDCVISSTARRARETTESLCAELGLNDDEVLWTDAVYDATAGQLLEVLARAPAAARRVLLVGHNPGLEDLLVWLGGDSVKMPPDRKLLTTAAAALLEMPEDWSGLAPGAGRLVELMRPKLLPD